MPVLEDLYRKARNIREHTRAQMVLLAVEQHLSAPAIAAIVREDDETVRQVLKRGEIVLPRPQHKIGSPDPEYLVKKDDRRDP